MNIRAQAPRWLRTGVRSAGIGWGSLTASRRPLPDFLVIGGQRCGTTSLFRALMTHPQIRRPVMTKGVNYFDLNYAKGEAWYRAHFPLRHPGDHTRLFDSSGYYMFHPLVAERVSQDLPAVKIVAMVRDPVERAYSAYKHELARGFEWEKSFARALELEDARLEGEVERMQSDPDYCSFNHRHHAYRRRGHYAELLAPFIASLGRDRLHVIESERFFANPEAEFRRLSEFLEIEDHLPASFDRHNARPGVGLDPEVQASLVDHFAVHDAALGEILGRAPVWRA